MSGALLIITSEALIISDALIIYLNTMKYFRRSKDRNHLENYVWAYVIPCYLA